MEFHLEGSFRSAGKFTLLSKGDHSLNGGGWFSDDRDEALWSDALWSDAAPGTWIGEDEFDVFRLKFWLAFKFDEFLLRLELWLLLLSFNKDDLGVVNGEIIGEG